MRPIRVLLAEDSEPMRGFLRRLLELSGEVEVVAEACNGAEAVALAGSREVDVCALDVSMPVLGGLEAGLEIKRENPEMRVLMLTMHRDPGYLERTRELGLDGFLVKDLNGRDLARAARALFEGGSYWSPELVVAGERGRGGARRD